MAAINNEDIKKYAVPHFEEYIQRQFVCIGSKVFMAGSIIGKCNYSPLGRLRSWYRGEQYSKRVPVAESRSSHKVQRPLHLPSPGNWGTSGTEYKPPIRKVQCINKIKDGRPCSHPILVVMW